MLTVQDSMIRDLREAMVKLGMQLSRFNGLLEGDDIARYERDMTLFKQLLALQSDHVQGLTERIQRAREAPLRLESVTTRNASPT